MICVFVHLYLVSGSFSVKSSKILIQPDITYSDLLEIVHICFVTFVPSKKKVAIFILLSVKWSLKYVSSKFDQIRATQFLSRLFFPFLRHPGR